MRRHSVLKLGSYFLSRADKEDNENISSYGPLIVVRMRGTASYIWCLKTTEIFLFISAVSPQIPQGNLKGETILKWKKVLRSMPTV
jgi:hypothetical protein